MRMALKILNKAGTLDFDTLIETTYDALHRGWNYYQLRARPDRMPWRLARS